MTVPLSDVQATLQPRDLQTLNEILAIYEAQGVVSVWVEDGDVSNRHYRYQAVVQETRTTLDFGIMVFVSQGPRPIAQSLALWMETLLFTQEVGSDGSTWVSDHLSQQPDEGMMALLQEHPQIMLAAERSRRRRNFGLNVSSENLFALARHYLT